MVLLGELFRETQSGGGMLRTEIRHCVKNDTLLTWRCNTHDYLPEMTGALRRSGGKPHAAAPLFPCG